MIDANSNTLLLSGQGEKTPATMRTDTGMSVTTCIKLFNGNTYYEKGSKSEDYGSPWSPEGRKTEKRPSKGGLIYFKEQSHLSRPKSLNNPNENKFVKRMSTVPSDKYRGKNLEKSQLQQFSNNFIDDTNDRNKARGNSLKKGDSMSLRTEFSSTSSKKPSVFSRSPSVQEISRRIIGKTREIQNISCIIKTEEQKTNGKNVKNVKNESENKKGISGDKKPSQSKLIKITEAKHDRGVLQLVKDTCPKGTNRGADKELTKNYNSSKGEASKGKFESLVTVRETEQDVFSEESSVAPNINRPSRPTNSVACPGFETVSSEAELRKALAFRLAKCGENKVEYTISG